LKQQQESISPTFYERNCANFLSPIKSLTFTSSTKKLCAKLSHKKATHKMLVKLTPDVQIFDSPSLFSSFNIRILRENLKGLLRSSSKA
jgi:hypothetical protein